MLILIEFLNFSFFFALFIIIFLLIYFFSVVLQVESFIEYFRIRTFVIIIFIKVLTMTITMPISGFTEPTPFMFVFGTFMLGVILMSIRFRIVALDTFLFGGTIFALLQFAVTIGSDPAPTVAPLLRHLGAYTILPLVAFHHMSNNQAWFITAVVLVMYCHSFYFTLGENFVVTPDDQALLFVQGLVSHVYPIYVLKTFRSEMGLIHSLLDKFLSVSEERSKEKTNFISRMSHELRTPLHGLLSSAGLLRQTRLSEEQFTFLSTIDSCGEVILDVITKILDITKIESGDFEKSLTDFSLFELLRGVSESMASLTQARGLALSIRFELHPLGHDVKGDKMHLREILLNVLPLLLSLFSHLLSNDSHPPCFFIYFIASRQCHQVHRCWVCGGPREAARHAVEALLEISL